MARDSQEMAILFLCKAAASPRAKVTAAVVHGRIELNQVQASMLRSITVASILIALMAPAAARADTISIECTGGHASTATAYSIDTSAGTVSWAVSGGRSVVRAATITASSIDFVESDAPTYKSHAHIDRATGQMTSNWSNTWSGQSGTIVYECRKGQGF